MAKTRFVIKRVYDEPSDGDGLRILVDRVWPRGMTKDAARLDKWVKGLAPTTDLRKHFCHDPEKFDHFRKRYFAELDENAELVQSCLEQWEGERVTLLYSAKDREHNQAVVLREYLAQRA